MVRCNFKRDHTCIHKPQYNDLNGMLMNSVTLPEGR